MIILLTNLIISIDFKEKKLLPSLSNTYGLLLHCLVDTGSVMLFEAVKLIDTAKARICQN